MFLHLGVMSCALCLKDKPLCESHLIPAAIHRLVKEQNELVVVATDKSFNTSKEVKEKLLCESCEALINKDEKYFLALGLQSDGAFPLQVVTERAPVITEVQGGTAHDTSNTNLDIESLSRFILSLFWRGSVGRWKFERRSPRTNSLGSKYNEIIRKYLLGNINFPEQVRILFLVSNSKSPNKFFHIPVSWREHGYHIHRVAIPGFQFTLQIGNLHSLGSLDSCFYHSKMHPIYLVNWVDRLQDRDILKLMRNSIPAGKLRKSMHTTGADEFATLEPCGPVVNVFGTRSPRAQTTSADDAMSQILSPIHLPR